MCFLYISSRYIKNTLICKIFMNEQTLYNLQTIFFKINKINCFKGKQQHLLDINYIVKSKVHRII